MKNFLLALLLLICAFLPAQAQDFPSSQFTVYRDFFSNRATILPWQASVNDPPNPEKAPDTALAIQVLQKPRFVLWLQPVERVCGFKLSFDF